MMPSPAFLRIPVLFVVWLTAEAYGNKTSVFVNFDSFEVRSVQVSYIDVHLTIITTA